ncbi:MAG TPA: Rieske 2Fe-2S domain-containing protein [Rubrivivax sp.]|nr:Rieske 2Fe-2S domain-containing protein [Rubrivivax sp.]
MTTSRRADDSSGIATPQTPLIRNAWYVAALSAEVSQTPIRRALLNHDVVLYRTEAGTPVAQQNRCPHRGMPMHLGTVKGDRIVCSYHGLEFDSGGRCTLMPASDSQPPAAMRLQCYPVVETGPLVWIWMGDPSLADPKAIPDTGWFQDSQWDFVHGAFYDMKSSYVRMHENLSDLSHFPFLHGLHGLGTLEYAKRKIHMESGDDSLSFWWEFEIPEVTELRLKHLGILGRRVHRRDEDEVLPGVRAGTSHFKVLDAKPGERADFASRLYHMLTPATQSTCHYFWATGFDVPYPAGTKPMMIEKIRSVFQEDIVACEGIEALAWEDRPDYRFTLMPLDWTVVQTGRYLHRLAMREQQAQAQKAGDANV